MKSKALITALLFAVVKMTAMADVGRPTYHYHALLFPEWLASKAGLPNGLVRGVLLSLALIILNYIRIRRKSGVTFLPFLRKEWISNIMICLLCLAGCLALKAEFPIGLVLVMSLSPVFIILNYVRVRTNSGSTFLLFLRKQWINNLMICLLCLVGCFVFFYFKTVKPGERLAGQFGGRVDVSVKPSPYEAYFQYLERTRRLENDLCLKCGTKMEHWYYMGRHTGCPKCDELYGTCKECGKEFNRFNRSALEKEFKRFNRSALEEEVDSREEVDPRELCNECNKSHGILVY